MTYFNTTDIKGDQLSLFTQKANSQDEKVLKYFKENPDKSFTAQEIHSILFDAKTPCSSIQRSCTNLKNLNKLIKTKQKEMGVWGRPCYKYVFQPNENLYINGVKNNK